LNSPSLSFSIFLFNFLKISGLIKLYLINCQLQRNLIVSAENQRKSSLYSERRIQPISIKFYKKDKGFLINTCELFDRDTIR
jgi:hypothetical protein